MGRHIGFPYPELEESPIFLILETLTSFLETTSAIPATAKNMKAKQKDIPKPRRSHFEEKPRIWMIYALVYCLHAGFVGSFDVGQGQDPWVGLPAEPTNSFRVKVMKP